jgi:flagellar basal-body rod modification protein FlgD
MQIFGVSAAAHAAQAQAQASAGSGSSSSLTNPASSLTSESTFLHLLVAQIKNQDPLNPTDSIQFVGQLVQYSELEQLLGINQGVQSLVKTTTPATNGTSSS